ncbi:MAG: hypothetical protein WCS89_00170 [Candidatus Paceibacterota bacterium]
MKLFAKTSIFVVTLMVGISLGFFHQVYAQVDGSVWGYQGWTPYDLPNLEENNTEIIQNQGSDFQDQSNTFPTNFSNNYYGNNYRPCDNMKKYFYFGGQGKLITERFGIYDNRSNIECYITFLSKLNLYNGLDAVIVNPGGPNIPLVPNVSGANWNIKYANRGVFNEIVLFEFVLDDLGKGQSSESRYWYLTVKNKSTDLPIVENLIAKNGKITIKVGPLTFDLSMKKSETCKKISGDGPNKIVFLRGRTSELSSSDLSGMANDFINRGFKSVQPIKKYSNLLSFYIDEVELDDLPYSSGDQYSNGLEYGINRAVRTESKCNSIDKGDTIYLLFYKGRTASTVKMIAYTDFDSRVIKLNMGSSKGKITEFVAVHEWGHAFAKLSDEYIISKEDYFGDLAKNIDSKNCTTKPFEDYVDSEHNIMYGSDNNLGCSHVYHELFDDNPKSDRASVFYRPSPVSIMDLYGHLLTPGAGQRFNVISCGYVISAMLNEPIMKKNAQKHWAECLQMAQTDGSVNADEIPVRRPTPTPSQIMPDPDDSNTYIVSGTGFSPTGNTVELTWLGSVAVKEESNLFADIIKQIFPTSIPQASAGFNDIFKIYNILSDGITLKFTVPPEAPAGKYSVRTSALNSDWSTNILNIVKTVGSAISRGNVNTTPPPSVPPTTPPPVVPNTPVTNQPATAYSLSVSKYGTGQGTVTGGSINCGSSCSLSDVTPRTSISLTAIPASGSTFSGWSGGGCSGNGSCNVTINTNLTVTAIFISKSRSSDTNDSDSDSNTPSTAVSGYCSTEFNSCVRGSFSDREDSEFSYNWSCLGSNGGADSKCSSSKVIVSMNTVPKVIENKPITFIPKPANRVDPKDYVIPDLSTTTTQESIDIKVPKGADIIKSLVSGIILQIMNGVNKTTETFSNVFNL